MTDLHLRIATLAAATRPIKDVLGFGAEKKTDAKPGVSQGEKALFQWHFQDRILTVN